MSKLIKAEWYGMSRRKILWILSLGVLAMTFVNWYMESGSGAGVSAWDGFINAYTDSFRMHLIMSCMYCYVFFGGDMESGVFKNVLSKGETNERIYLVKLLLNSLYSVAVSVIICLIACLSAVILLGASTNPDIFSDLSVKTVHFLLFVLASNAVAYFFLMVFRTGAPIWMFLYLTLIPALAGLLFSHLLNGKLLFLMNLFISGFIERIIEDPTNGYRLLYFGIAAVFYIVAGAAGFFLFRKKEY